MSKHLLAYLVGLVIMTTAVVIIAQRVAFVMSDSACWTSC